MQKKDNDTIEKYFENTDYDETPDYEPDGPDGPDDENYGSIPEQQQRFQDSIEHNKKMQHRQLDL